MNSAKNHLSGNINLLLAFVLFISGVFLYLNTLQHSFVYDDISVISENRFVNMGISGMPEILRHSYRYGYDQSFNDLYRPVSQIMFAVEWELFPHNPLPGHLMNIILYGLTSVLLFFTFKGIFGKEYQLLVFLSILLFTAHPIHSEVVANIKSRDEILAFIFSILALNLYWKYIKNKNAVYLVSALLSFLLAMFSKEGSAGFLFVIPLVVFYFYNEPDKRKRLFQSSLFVVPFILYLVARFQVLGGFEINDSGVLIIDNNLVGGNLLERWSTAFVYLGIYLFKLMIPYELVHDMSYNQLPLVGLSDYRSWLSLIVFSGILVGGVLSFKKNKIISFSLFYFLITLGLYSNLFTLIGTNYAERVLYFSSLGICLFLVSIFMYFLKSNHKAFSGISQLIRQNGNLVFVVLLVLSLYSFKTVDRNKDWETSYSLFHADILKSPESAHLRFNYGIEIMKEKGLNAHSPVEALSFLNLALENVQKALDLYPDYHQAFEQIGLVHYRMGNQYKIMLQQARSLNNKENIVEFEQKLVHHYTTAKNQYEASVLKNESAVAYQNLGAICFDFGQLDLALKYSQKSLELEPANTNTLFNLGSIYGTKGDYTRAIESFNLALSYGHAKPSSVHLFIAQTYRFLKDENNAKKHEQMAQKLQKK